MQRLSQMQSGDRDLQDNGWLIYAREYITETLLDTTFLEDVANGKPKRKGKVAIPGNHKLDAALWLNAGSGDSPHCCNLLHLLLATEAPAAGMAQVGTAYHLHREGCPAAHH